MRWLLLGLLVAGLVLVGYGNHLDAVGRSADEKLGAVIPWAAGTLLLALDGVMLIVAVVRRSL